MPAVPKKKSKEKDPAERRAVPGKKTTISQPKKPRPKKSEEAKLYDSVIALHSVKPVRSSRKKTVDEELSESYDYDDNRFTADDQNLSWRHNEPTSYQYDDTPSVRKLDGVKRHPIVFSSTLFHKPIRHTITQGMVAIAILVIVGAYVSPKISAESIAFYPTSCLGGWNNVSHAEGITEVSENKQREKFTQDNSAILPTGMVSDIYCGGFTGEVKKNTKPTKVILSLSWSPGDIIIGNATPTKEIISDSFASSSAEIIDTKKDVLVNITESTSTIATSTSATTTTEKIEKLDNKDSTTSSDTSSTTTLSTSVETKVTGGTLQEETASSTTKEKIMSMNTLRSLLGYMIDQQGPSAYADEGDGSAVQPQQEVQTPLSAEGVLQKVESILSTPTSLPNVDMGNKSSEDNTVRLATTTFVYDASSSFDILPSLSSSTGGLVATPTTTAPPSVSQVETPVVTNDEPQNTFLEVMYTYDGVTWHTLGKVNEETLIYTTFEIPVTSTTSWEDLSHIQVRIRSLSRVDETPTIYLDGMKLDVLYDTPVLHEHPDFARDSIIKETQKDALHVINLINSDTNTKEIWYTAPGMEGGLGIASSSWVQLDMKTDASSYRLLEVFDKEVMWIDDIQKKIWMTDLDRVVSESARYYDNGTSGITFMRVNGEEWTFDYNAPSKRSFFYKKKNIPGTKVMSILRADGELKVKKSKDGTKDVISITPTKDAVLGTFDGSGAHIEYIGISQEPYVLPLDGRGDGVYTYILTSRGDGCSSLSEQECTFDSAYLGEVKVLITTIATSTEQTLDVKDKNDKSTNENQ